MTYYGHEAPTTGTGYNAEGWQEFVGWIDDMTERDLRHVQDIVAARLDDLEAMDIGDHPEAGGKSE